MSDLDKELKSALDDADDGAEPVVVKGSGAEPAPMRPEPKKKANTALLIGLLVIAGAIVGVVMFGMRQASVYAMKVEEVVDQAGSLKGRKLRVDGELVPGTLVKKDSPCEYRFRMRIERDRIAKLPNTAERELSVRYAKCEIPDTFRDMPEGGVLVTVEGSLADPSTLEATDVFAKCSSKYDPKSHEMSATSGQVASEAAPPGR
jgi:cytochrome c-type biogenesis protein CcmE